MATSSISIDKSLGFIQHVSPSKVLVSTHKMGAFATLLNGLNSVSITSQCIKPSKLAKYVSILNDNGFNLKSTNYESNCGFDGINSDCINVSLEFAR